MSDQPVTGQSLRKIPRVPAGMLGAGVGLVLILLAVFSLTVVETGQVGVVIRAGSDQVRVIAEPGVYGRLPFVERVWLIDTRLQTAEQSAALPYITTDKQTVPLAGWVAWRVLDPVRFNAATSSGKTPVDEKLLKAFSETLAGWVSGRTSAAAVQGLTESAMAEFLGDLNQRLEPLGVQAAGAGLRQAGLSEAATEAIYDRMSATRTRSSRQLIDGLVADERQVVALQNRQQQQVLDDAYRTAQQVRQTAENQLLAAYARRYGSTNTFVEALKNPTRTAGKSDQ
mgnify:CR=1 FL=1